MPYRVQLDGLQILWLLANPLWTHGIGESGSKTITGWLSVRAAGANPFWGFLLQPSTYRTMHLPFWYLNIFSLHLRCL